MFVLIPHIQIALFMMECTYCTIKPTSKQHCKNVCHNYIPSNIASPAIIYFKIKSTSGIISNHSIYNSVSSLTDEIGNTIKIREKQVDSVSFKTSSSSLYICFQGLLIIIISYQLNDLRRQKIEIIFPVYTCIFTSMRGS